MAAFCANHGYSGRRHPELLVERLRSAPAGATGPAITKALREAVLAYVGVLTALNTAIRQLERAVAAQLDEHPDGKVFRSFPRAGIVSAAQILAEWGDARQADDGPEAIAALAGLVPVTKKSGKQESVHFRWACNKRLRVALTTSPTIPGTAVLGPPRSIAAPVHPTRTIHTRSASSPALGYG